jgi:putative addiction module component (TIGR02574 family)
MSAAELKKEVLHLSKAERLQVMESLWTSLSKKQEDIESPACNGEVLATRKAKVDADKAKFLRVAQLKTRLRPGWRARLACWFPRLAQTDFSFAR